MKRIYIFLLLNFSLTCVSARPPEKRFTLGVTGSLEYSCRYLKSDADMSWLKDLRDENEHGIPGFSVAFHAQRKICKNIYADFSLAMVRKGYATEKRELIYEQAEPGAPVNVRSRYTKACIEVPVNIQFHPVDSGAFFMSLGLAPVLPLVQMRKTFYGYEDGTIDTKRETTINGEGTVSLSAYAGIGYNFILNKKIFIQANPFCRCDLTRSNGENVKEYYYAFGLNVGVFFSRNPL